MLQIVQHEKLLEEIGRSGPLGRAFVQTQVELDILLAPVGEDIDLKSVFQQVKEIHRIVAKYRQSPELPKYPLSLDGAIRYMNKVRDWLDARLSTKPTECDAEPPAAKTEQGEGNGGKITLEEANSTAMKLAKKDAAFVNGGVREWAAAIRKATGKTCSIATVRATQLWRETMRATGRGRTKGRMPRAVALTGNMESAVGEGGQHEILDNVIAEQEADYEPSPLDNDPPGKHRKVKHYKRV